MVLLVQPESLKTDTMLRWVANACICLIEAFPVLSFFAVVVLLVPCFHTCVPVKEGLAAEHGGELLRDALEEFLDGCGVADERGGHLESAGRNVADGRLHVVRDPLDEVAAVLVLNVQHLLVDFL